jgi:hypothetical protein
LTLFRREFPHSAQLDNQIRAKFNNLRAKATHRIAD